MELQDMHEYEDKARKLLLKRFNKILENHNMPQSLKDKINEGATFDDMYSRYWGVLTIVLNSLDEDELKRLKVRAKRQTKVEVPKKYEIEKPARKKGNNITIEDLAYHRLLELKNPYRKKEIISFKDVMTRLCTMFCIPKNDAFIILHQLQDNGLIEIIPHKGIRI